MNAEKLEAIKVLLLANSMEFVLNGKAPVSPSLHVQPEQKLLALGFSRSREGFSAEAVCVGNVLGHYLHSETLAGSAKLDYPNLYEEVESRILGCKYIIDCLSAVADYLSTRGDDVAYRRLVASGRYISTSIDKKLWQEELGSERIGADHARGLDYVRVLDRAAPVQSNVQVQDRAVPDQSNDSLSRTGEGCSSKLVLIFAVMLVVVLVSAINELLEKFNSCDMVLRYPSLHTQGGLYAGFSECLNVAARYQGCGTQALYEIKALKICYIASERGCDWANVFLGNSFEYGANGVGIDKNSAKKFYSKAPSSIRSLRGLMRLGVWGLEGKYARKHGLVQLLAEHPDCCESELLDFVKVGLLDPSTRAYARDVLLKNLDRFLPSERYRLIERFLPEEKALANRYRRSAAAAGDIIARDALLKAGDVSF